VNIYREKSMLIMKTSLVSIIIPTFNSEKFILEAIQSVQNQTYENWELILVDDCSSDNTVLF
jgi:glycosyltransferase involved in cell wall biosynthesis